ncbi:hypothetical protein TNCV_2774051 [Trichonephila clavipes]|nr:hypothetical protein TNCV_2774051 [Trichonephila clavipes]
MLKEAQVYTRAFGDGPRNFEPWSSDVDDTLAPPPNYHTTPTGGRFSYRFNVHRCPTRRVFSGTGIELMTCLPWLDTLTTGLPQPCDTFECAS